MLNFRGAHSLKPTASLHLKIDVWKVKLPLGMAYFWGGTMLVLGRVRISWWIPIWAGAPRRTDVPLLKILSQTRLLEELGLEGCSWEVRNHASMDNMTGN